MDSSSALIPKNRLNPKIFDRNKIKNERAWSNSSILTSTILKNDKSTNLDSCELKVTLQPLLNTQKNHNHTVIIINDDDNDDKKTIVSDLNPLRDDLKKQQMLQQKHTDGPQNTTIINSKDNICSKNILNDLMRNIETANNSNELRINKINEGCYRNIPWVALVISFIQITMFSFATASIYHILLYTPYRRYQIWRFWTYTLLHSDRIHLMINIALQFLTSFFIEMEQGHLKVLFIYMMGGIFGSLGTSVFQPKLLMVGSSAGVYSLLMSHVPHLIMNFRVLPYRYLRIVAVMILCTSDIGFSIYHCLLHSNQSPQISLAAHLSGASAGFLLAFIIYSKAEYKIFKIFQYLSMSIFCSFLIFAIFFNFNCIPVSQNKFKCFL